VSPRRSPAAPPDAPPLADDTLALDALIPDPANARRHTPRNTAMVEASLRELGAARSIVIDEDGVVLAGNQTVRGAAAAGLTRVRVVDADGTELIAVRRSGLSPDAKLRLALYDNRTAELAEWDPDALTGLLDDDPAHLAGLFDDGEVATIRALAAGAHAADFLDDLADRPADDDAGGPTELTSPDAAGYVSVTLAVTVADRAVVLGALRRRQTAKELPTLAAALVDLCRDA
jgi:hypothetical protein